MPTFSKRGILRKGWNSDHKGMETGINLLTDSSAFQKMKGEWNALLKESESDNVFLTWEWLYTWWDIYGKTSELNIIVVRDPSGGLVGIAPFKISMRKSLGIGRVRVLEFIGCGGDVTTEYLNIIAKRGWESIVYNKVAESIFQNRSWEKVDLRHFSSTSFVLPAFIGFLKQRGTAYRIERSSICPSVALTKSWDEYLSVKSFNFRKKTKEYLRRSRRDLNTHLILCDSSETLQSSIDELIALHMKRWGRRSQAFKTGQYLSFHRKVSGLFMEKGWLRLFFLMQGEKPLAGIYCFFYNNKYYYYQSGRDPKYSKYRLGNVLLSKTIAAAINEGADEFDFLTGDEAYKLRWANQRKETVRLSFQNNENGKWNKYLGMIEGIWDRVRRSESPSMGHDDGVRITRLIP